MNPNDQQFINFILECTDEEFEAMMDMMTMEELADVLAMVREARSIAIMDELECIDDMVAEDECSDAVTVLKRYIK